MQGSVPWCVWGSWAPHHSTCILHIVLGAVLHRRSHNVRQGGREEERGAAGLDEEAIRLGLQECLHRGTDRRDCTLNQGVNPPVLRSCSSMAMVPVDMKVCTILSLTSACVIGVAS